jgi:Na+/H+ antiporter NhaA
MNRLGVIKLGPYLVIGLILWVCVLKSGVHATLAGVALALCIPLRTRHAETSPLLSLEHALHPWVAYAILPLFALPTPAFRWPVSPWKASLTRSPWASRSACWPARPSGCSA